MGFVSTLASPSMSRQASSKVLGADGQWSAAAAVELHAALPAHLRCNAWRLAFSTLQRGASLSSLYRPRPRPAIKTLDHDRLPARGLLLGPAGNCTSPLVFTAPASAGLWSAAAPGRAAGCYMQLNMNLSPHRAHHKFSTNMHRTAVAPQYRYY